MNKQNGPAASTLQTEGCIDQSTIGCKTQPMKIAFRRYLILPAIGLTIFIELVTIATRLLSGMSAAEYTAASNTPVVLQLHHMFWAIPFAVAAFAMRRFIKACLVLCAISIGLILSDLIHHFIFLPLYVGNIGWHWP